MSPPTIPTPKSPQALSPDCKHMEISSTPAAPLPLPLSFNRLETSLDRDIDARMRFDFSPRQPIAASLEIYPCTALSAPEKIRELNNLLPKWAIDGSAIPLNFESTQKTVTQVLIEIQRNAAFIKGFPPLALWRKVQRRNWERNRGVCSLLRESIAI